MLRTLALTVFTAFTVSAFAADGPRCAPAEPPDMVRIFNGTDLTGWDGDPELWSVRDGAIRGETTPEKPAKGNTFLIWKDGRS